MIDGIRVSILGNELKEELLNRASDFRKHGLVEVDAKMKNTLLEVAALYSYIADHLEDEQVYRLTVEQAVKFELHKNRVE